MQNIIVTVDIALFTLKEGRLCLGLLKRSNEPFAGSWALPGGFVHDDEDGDMAATARRVLKQKIGIEPSYLEQLYTFSGTARDPRGWSLSVCYYALVPDDELVPANVPESAEEFQLLPVEDLPRLPFDHDEIVSVALARLRGKSTYSTLPAFLLPKEFTMAELKAIYEQVSGETFDKVSFRRKVEEQGLVKPIKGKTRTAGGRPAQVYRLAGKHLVEFERKIYAA